MEWLYLALTLLASVLGVLANVLPLIHWINEHKHEKREDKKLVS